MIGRRGRARILAALREGPVEVPVLPPVWNRGDGSLGDLRPRYESALRAAGGQARTVGTGDGGAALTAELVRLAAEIDAAQIGSAVVGLPGAHDIPGCTVTDLSDIRDPHELIDIDLAIVPGQFGVAENGAVWVSGTDLRQQALCFSCEHLALLVPAATLVPDMHAAYARLALAGAQVRRAAFGVFISGPSKTADIEQALVLGAHGPRSLTVFLLGDATSSPRATGALPPPAT